uniref:Uncharacterized protein n=1 Tax=uncultured marine virus TaxID=186617 RepID=A0A0F7L981_9VIRU|nr:hypothetical protein [uncultured marine virus]
MKSAAHSRNPEVTSSQRPWSLLRRGSSERFLWEGSLERVPDYLLLTSLMRLRTMRLSLIGL